MNKKELIKRHKEETKKLEEKKKRLARLEQEVKRLRYAVQLEEKIINKVAKENLLEEMKYNIVLKDNNSFILASCKTMELAKEYLEDIIKTDKELQKSYNWTKLPEYKIIKKVEEVEK